MENKYIISSSPQWTEKESIPKIMYTVVICLVPSLVVGVYFYGLKALILTIIAIASAMLTEYLIQKIFGMDFRIADGSALLTGVLLAFNLPPDVPYWIPVLGSFFAIAIGKMVFGGLGCNPLNPALVGRVFLMASWPVFMTSKWLPPKGGTLSGIQLDGITNATPLNLYKTNLEIIQTDSVLNVQQQAEQVINQLNVNWLDFLYGRIGGCIGETSALALFIPAIYLIYKRYIDWRIPLSYIITTGFLGWAFGGYHGIFSGNFLFHILTGGLFLGAFYMATDMVTSPLTKRGKLIFGIGCGLITIVIRLWGGYPEGVSYSILLMNLAVPLIDKYTIRKKFGEVTYAQ